MNVNNNITHPEPALHRNRIHQDIHKVQTNAERRNEATHSKQTAVSHDTVKQKQDVKTAVDKLNEFNDPVYTNVKFVMHDELEKYYVKVVDPKTDEVIREIPPEKMLDIYAQIADYMGLLVDEKV